MKTKFTTGVRSLLMLLAFFFVQQSFAQLTPKLQSLNAPFRINGEVVRTNSAADWVYSYLWPNLSLLDSATGDPLLSNSLNPLIFTYHARDVYNGNSGNPDNQFDGGNKSNGNPTGWGWKLPSNAVLNKNDINNVLVHFTTSKTNSDTVWALLGIDRNTTNGTSYVDFEFYQNAITANAPSGSTNGSFSTTGTACGRTVGDMLITVQYTNGGAVDTILFFKWLAVSGSGCGYDWVGFSIPNSLAFGYSTNVSSAPVPYGAFGGTTYSNQQMAEVAINLSAVIDSIISADPCRGLIYRSLFVKSKSSASTTADLKDMIYPISIDLNLGIADISYPGPFCVPSGPHSVSITGPANTLSGTYAMISTSLTTGTGNVSVNSSTGAVTISNGASGKYAVEYSYTPRTGCNKKDTAYFDVNPKPTPNFTFNNACIGTTTSFTNTSSGATSYLWRFGDGTTSTATSPTKTYAAAGTYSVKLIATSAAGCRDSVTKSVTVNPNPTPNFTATDVCVGVATSFTNTSSGGASYTWNFGDGNTSSSANPSHTYASPGIYFVKLIATSSNGCIDSVSKNVTVFGKPVPNFTAPDVCLGVATTFTNSSSGASSYLWHFGDGTTSTSTNPSKTYASAGSYSAKLIATSVNGCKDSITKTVTVNGKPVPNFTAPAVCVGETTTFTNTSSGAATYVWHFGDGTTSTATSPTKTYATAGSYSAKLIATSSAGCKDSVTKTVTVNGKPVPNFTAPAVCVGETTTFTNTSSGAASYVWHFGDGTTSTATSPTKTYATAGSYSAKLIATSSAGCKDSVTKTVTVNGKPVPNFTVANACYGTTSSFTNTSTGASSYFWSFGDGGTSTATNPTRDYASNGTYTVKLIATSAAGCKDSVSKSTTVYENPSVTGTITNAKCYGDSNGSIDITVTGGTPNYSYLWNNSATTEDLSGLPAGGPYEVVVTDANGCKDTFNAGNVLQPKKLVIQVGSNSPICSNGSLSLYGGPNGYPGYHWTGPNGFSDTNINVTLPSTSDTTLEGYYTLEVVDSIGCAVRDSTPVVVYQSPTVTLDTFAPVCKDATPFVLTGGSPMGGIYTGTGVDSGKFKPLLTGIGYSDITYTYTDSNGCQDSATEEIEVLQCGEAFCSLTQGFWGSGKGKFCYYDSSNATVAKGIHILGLLLKNNDLVLGELATSCTGAGATRSFTIKYKDTNALVAVMPAGGTSKAFNAATGSCSTPTGKYNSVFTSGGSISPAIATMKKNGSIGNTLIGQAISLSLNVRLDTTLGGLKVTGNYMITERSQDCKTGRNVGVGDQQYVSIPSSIMSYLGSGYTVNDLLALANKALSGSYSPTGNKPSLNDINGALDAFNVGFDECRILVEFTNTNPGAAPRTMEQEGDEEMPVQNSLNSKFVMMPNPATSEVTFDLSSFMGSKADLQIYNQIGELVWDRNFESIEMPVYTLSFGEGTFAEGVYYVKFITNGTAITQKLFITRN